MLKKANVIVTEDLSKRTRENRQELRKFLRQVRDIAKIYNSIITLHFLTFYGLSRKPDINHLLKYFSFQIKRVNPEKACYLEYDKLYVDSKIFIWNDALGQVIEQAEAERYGTYSELQSYVIKSAPWTILWFRILGIFSVEHIKRLCVFMFQTCSNSLLCTDSQYSSQ